jgi:hypothetical protein
MAVSLPIADYLEPSRQAKNGDGSGLGAAIEADAASGAVMSGITRGMNAVMAELGRKFEALGRAGLDA